MKVNPRPLSALAALALTLAPVMADTVMVVSTADSGTEDARIAVSDIGKVTFSEGMLSVFGVQSSPMTQMDLSKICRISFADSETSVRDLYAATGMRLRQNPVEDHISVDGVPYGSSAAIFDLSGRRMLSLSAWDGGDIDVSGLHSGTYLLVINSQTFKVIKK